MIPFAGLFAALRPMQPSDEGLASLAEEEGGVWLHTYRDQRGLPTIGIGHLLRAGENYCDAGCDPKKGKTCSRGITVDHAYRLFRADLSRFVAAIHELVEVPLTQNQFDALVMLVFNIGEGERGFKGSTLLKKLNEGDYVGAQEQFHVWRMGDGKVLPVLVERRAREARIFGTP